MSVWFSGGGDKATLAAEQPLSKKFMPNLQQFCRQKVVDTLVNAVDRMRITVDLLALVFDNGDLLGHCLQPLAPSLDRATATFARRAAVITWRCRTSAIRQHCCHALRLKVLGKNELSVRYWVRYTVLYAYAYCTSCNS